MKLTITKINTEKMTKKENKVFNAYFESLEKESLNENYDSTYEASNGDYEGACLARAEFEAGYIS